MNYLKRLIILTILLLFVTVVFQPAYADDPPLPTPVGRVVWVKGTLKATMPNNEQRLLQKTSVIYLNDTLNTDKDSQAQIIFTDNSLMTFRPGTTFYVEKYEFKPKAKGASVGTYVMKLIEGGFRTITGLIAKHNPNDYKVNTPVATIGVRGTDYAVYIHGGQLAMAFYAGTPCMNNAQGTLCLGSAVPYGGVSVGGGAPAPIKTQPAVFREKLDIVPAKIAPFTGGAGGATSYSGPQRGSSSGPITSFCITQ